LEPFSEGVSSQYLPPSCFAITTVTVTLFSQPFIPLFPILTAHLWLVIANERERDKRRLCDREACLRPNFYDPLQ
jgi:hypothetical protein